MLVIKMMFTQGQFLVRYKDNMNATLSQTLIIGVLVVAFVIGVFVFYWSHIPQEPIPVSQDYKVVSDIMINDSYLHRLLMIETLSAESTSHSITFAKMSTGIELLGKSFVNPFGVTKAQRISSLINQRNTILRKYYTSIKNISNDQIADYQLETSPLMVMTFSANRELELVTREIIDSIASVFHIKDVISTGSGTKRPVLHFQRLFNLLTMYDKELINQAKAYRSAQYDISMNCAQSSLEAANHIGSELKIIMEHATNMVQTQ